MDLGFEKIENELKRFLSIILTIVKQRCIDKKKLIKQTNLSPGTLKFLIKVK